MSSKNGSTTNSHATNGAATRLAGGAGSGGAKGATAPAAPTRPAPTRTATQPVVLDDAYLAINRLAVYGTPVDAARECVERGEDLEASVRRMLDIGAALVQHGGSRATADAAEGQIDRLLQGVTQTVAENLPRSIQEQLGAFAGVLAQYLDPKQAGSVQRQLEGIMQAGARSQRQEVTRALMDEHGPFAVFKAELDGKLSAISELVPHVAALREQLTAMQQVAAEHERGTAKGTDYELVVGETLCTAFAPHRDTVEHVATQLGAERSKRGDYLAMLNPDTTSGADVKVVVECKVRSRVGVRAALAELERAMGNREASAGLLVLGSADGTALGGLPLRVYPGNRVVVHLDRDKPDPLALEIGCGLIRELAAASARSRGHAVDLAALEEDVARVTDAVEKAKAIASGVKVARKGIQNIEDAYTRLRNEATDALTGMARRLRETPDTSD